MKAIKKIICTTVCISLLFSFVSCASIEENVKDLIDASNEESSQSSKPVNADVNIFSVAYNANATQNPILTTDIYNFYLSKIIYQPLVDIANDYKPKLVLAKSISHSGNVYTLELKSGIKFHDGSALTAEDVVYSYNTARNSSDSIYQKNFKAIKSFKASGNKFIVTLKKQVPLPEALFNIPIIKKYSSHKDYKHNGTGPYKLEYEYKLPVLVKYEDNGIQGKIQKIRLIKIENADKLTSQFEAGIVNAIYSETIDYTKIKSSYKTADYNYNKFVFLGINSSNDILKNKNIRQAISSAVDKTSVISDAIMKNGVVADYPFNPNFYQMSELNLPQNKCDVSKSKNLVKDMAGIKLRLIYNAGDKSKKAAADNIVKALNEIGIALEVLPVNSADFSANLKNGNYDLCIASSNIPLNMDISYLIAGNGGENYFGGYDEIDKAYSAYIADNKKLREFCSVFNDVLPIIPLYFENGSVFFSNMTNFSAISQNNVYFDIENWTLSR